MPPGLVPADARKAAQPYARLVAIGRDPGAEKRPRSTFGAPMFRAFRLATRRRARPQMTLPGQRISLLPKVVVPPIDPSIQPVATGPEF